MRVLTPVEVLAILAERLEKRAEALERVRLDGYNVAIAELRNFARMTWEARDYLQDGTATARKGAGVR